MKVIEGYEGLYSVTSNGEVYSHRANRLLKVQECGEYKTISLAYKGVTTTVNIHRLVAETFLTRKEGLPCVNHIDGDKHNNSVCNLEWCTYSENLTHAYDTGLRNKGNTRSVSDTDVHLICKYLLDGWKQNEVAKSLGLTVSQVKNVTSRPAYLHITREYDLTQIPSRKNKISTDKVLLIAKGLEEGSYSKDVARNFNVSPSLVSNIKTRKIYSELTKTFKF